MLSTGQSDKGKNFIQKFIKIRWGNKIWRIKVKIP